MYGTFATRRSHEFSILDKYIFGEVNWVAALIFWKDVYEHLFYFSFRDNICSNISINEDSNFLYVWYW